MNSVSVLATKYPIFKGLQVAVILSQGFTLE